MRKLHWRPCPSIYKDVTTTLSTYQSISAFLKNLFQEATGNAVSLGNAAFSAGSTLKLIYCSSLPRRDHC
jgi:hypothetical protein